MSKGLSDELSERELEILRLIATGASNKEIAQELFISANTVKVHLRNIFAKIGAASRTEAALYAIRLGLTQETQANLNERLAQSEVLLPEGTQIPVDSEPMDLTVPAPIDLKQVKPAEEIKGISSVKTWGSDFRISRLGMGVIGFSILIVVILLILRNPLFIPAAMTATLSQTPTQPPLSTPAKSRWTLLASEPLQRQKFAVTAINNAVYIIGGEASGKVIGTLGLYQPSDDQWSTLAEKPLPVADIRAAVVDGLVVVPGGRTETGAITTAVEIYNPALNVWKTAESMPEPRSEYALAAWEGRIYLFGGWDGKNYTQTVFRYDLTADAWAELTPMPTARGLMGAVASDGKIYVYGGWNGKNALALNEVYTPALENAGNSPWSTAASLPEARYGFGSAGIAFFAYAVGGIDSDQNELPPAQYNIQENRWVTFTPPEYDLGRETTMTILSTNLHIFSNTQIHLSYEAVKIVVIPLIAP